MGAGKQYRLRRIFGDDGRTLVLPVDHGLQLGRIPGLEDPARTVRQLVDLRFDGLLMSTGLARHTAIDLAAHPSVARIVTLDTFYRDSADSAPAGGLVASVESAVRLGVDGIKLFMAWDVPSDERIATLDRIGKVIEHAHEYELPVMLEPIASAGDRSAETLALESDAVRIAMEVGADIIKAAYPGPELMRQWASEVQVPLVMLGGPRTPDTEAVIASAAEALECGASGIVIGRNVWQRPIDEARIVLERLHGIVHARPTG